MKINKKFFCLFMAMVCVLSLALTGCGKPDDTMESTKGTTASTTEPTTVPTTAAPTEPSAPEFDPHTNKTWAEDGVFKFLIVGNSFSNDVMEYVFDIASAAGVKDMVLGNLYIGNCSLATHLKHAKADDGAYTYYTNDFGAWIKNSKYKLSDAVKSENWDFIAFQQAPQTCGMVDTYKDLEELRSIVAQNCTNPKVEFVWHMTWACADSYTGSLFNNYQMSQEVMYNAIIDATKWGVFTNDNISRVIPNGTVMQNIRTSYFGDNVCRDGLHLSLPHGRILGGIGIVAATVGIDYDTIDLSDLHEDEKFLQVALEGVKNAMENLYQVTQSKITK